MKSIKQREQLQGYVDSNKEVKPQVKIPKDEVVEVHINKKVEIVYHRPGWE
jgi:hypothetical protein